MSLSSTNQAFSTSYNYQKIGAEGSVPVSIPNLTWTSNTQPIAYTTVTIAHNLGIIPTVRLFYLLTGSIWMYPFPGPYGNIGSIDGTPGSGRIFATSGAGPYTSVWFDTTNIYLRITNTTGSTQTYTIYWRAYYDTAA